MYTQEQAKHIVRLLFDDHFCYSKEINNYKPTTGDLKKSVNEIETKIRDMLTVVYQEFYDREEAFKHVISEKTEALNELTYYQD